MWAVPAKDLYQIRIDVENVGLDVKGGDGGVLTVSRLGAGENSDARIVERVAVPLSSDAVPHAQSVIMVDAEVGDRIVLRINAGLDGYADRWKLRYTIARSGPEGYLAQPPPRAQTPLRAQTPGAPLRRGLFFVGTDGGWANSSFAEESMRMLRRYVPNLGAVMIAHTPERLTQPPFYRAANIPTLIQTWGATYEPYLGAKGAFEITWKGEDLSKPGFPLSGTTHAMSLPHPASREAFERVVRSAIRSGYSGFGFPDLVWMWGGGRGASGYNPATIAAFRQDLQGLDEGLPIMPLSGHAAVWKFADYARFYGGGMPPAAAFGSRSWAAYQPITFEQYSKKLKSDYTPDFLLFDLLVHYEWLKMANFLGRVARSENGVFQAMPNPEDVANGADFLLAGQLSNVAMLSEEYFAGPEYLDGAYFHNPYYGRSAAKNRSSLGVVMEGGGGGNDVPYYDNEIAYATALELTLATQADHMEGDFWPSARIPLSEGVKSPLLLARYRQILSYGLGFTDAKKDGLKRLAPDFLSVSSRRLFRPWDAGWNRWAWTTFFRLSPENALTQAGFNFLGIGAEGLSSLIAPQKVVLFSGDLPTEQSWQQFTQMIGNGRIERGITVAGALQEVVTNNFARRPFISRFPQMNFQVQDVAPSGALRMRGTRLGAGSYNVVGAIYADKGGASVVVMTLGGQPLVVERRVGKGKLYVLLFDPSLRDNTALTTVVYSALLGQDRIARRWQATNGCVARLYRNGDLMAVGVQHPRLRMPSQAGPDFIAKRAWPYKIDVEIDLKVLLVPRRIYDWVALPSADSGQATADKNGFIRLRHSGTAQEIFYLLPHRKDSAAKLAKIRARKEIFNQAMSVEGRVPAIVQ